MKVADKSDYLATYRNKKLGKRSLRTYGKWFPIKSSELLADFVASITGDGHLSQGLVQFIAKEKAEVLAFQSKTKRLFGLKGNIRRSPSNPNTWELVIGNNALYRVLKLCEVPEGNKTEKKFLIPSWIMKSSRSIKASYIRALFDCEGSVYLKKDTMRIYIKLKFHKAENRKENLVAYLTQIREILDSFGIKSTNITRGGYTTRKDGSRSIGLETVILGTRKNCNSVVKFAKYIGFDNKRKSKILRESINALGLTAPVAKAGKAQFG